MSETKHCTVAQLIELLRDLPGDLPVVGAWEGIECPVFVLVVSETGVLLWVGDVLEKSALRPGETVRWAAQRGFLDFGADEDRAYAELDALKSLPNVRKELSK